MNVIIILWNSAVFLAAILSMAIVDTTLTPRFSKRKTYLYWFLIGACAYMASLFIYQINLYNDFFGILGLSFIVCLATHWLYIGEGSMKLFTSVMAALISNVTTFLICGTLDTFLGKELGFIIDTPYTVSNIILFIGIKAVTYIIFYFLYVLLLRARTQAIFSILQGKMMSYIPASVVSLIGFYAINSITNRTGILPGSVYFFPLYLTVCTIFVLEYIQIYTSISWSAKAMKNEAELSVANSIQHNMLPCIFPAFPERTEFDVYAAMIPAKEVGGDFYDFFLVDEDHIALVIADVSGKGIPAALFMVIAKTLLKNSAINGLSPKEVLEKVNNQLCENNEAEMFVTVWLGILEISTGKMTCANAGHEYPTIKRSNGAYELLKDKHGFVLAGMEDMRYTEYEVVLHSGDKVFLYTDGVVEATNSADELYGSERMLHALNCAAESSPEETLVRVKEDIDLFVGNAPQFDDLTMLLVELR